jgi:2-keto-4-pentenoate hydratase
VRDDRLVAGMRAQLAARDEAVRGGARQIGWKLGFGSPPALERFALDRPLVGYLLDRGLIPDAGTVEVRSWTQPMLEPELAVHLSRDVPPEASWEDVRASVLGLSAAIELADVDVPPQDVATILAGNIFHRHVMLGAADSAQVAGRGLTVDVHVDGREVASTDSPEALTGDLVEIVRLTAQGLAAFDEFLRAGDVIITGSVVAPLAVVPGSTVRTRTEGLGLLSVTLG